MTQEWISSTDHRWQMRCGTRGCGSVMPPTEERRTPSDIRAAGWAYGSHTHEDRCPACVATAQDIADRFPKETRDA